MADKFAAIEAARAARTRSEATPVYEAPVDPVVREAQMAVEALRAVLSQLSPAPAWRAQLADMAAAALARGKGRVSRELWANGWRLVYIEREKRAVWRARR